MIVNRNGEHLFRGILTHHICIQLPADFSRLRHTQTGRLAPRIFVELLIEDAFADVYTVVANVDAGTSNELAHLSMALAAERAHCQVRCAGHIILLLVQTFKSSSYITT